jgi:hypothetical protein
MSGPRFEPDLPRAQFPDREHYDACRFDIDSRGEVRCEVGEAVDFERALIRVMFRPGSDLAELRQAWPKLRDLVNAVIGE